MGDEVRKLARLALNAHITQTDRHEIATRCREDELGAVGSDWGRHRLEPSQMLTGRDFDCFTIHRPTCRLEHNLHAHVRGFFFFNDTAPAQIYTLSLHDALPI